MLPSLHSSARGRAAFRATPLVAIPKNAADLLSNCVLFFGGHAHEHAVSSLQQGCSDRRRKPADLTPPIAKRVAEVANEQAACSQLRSALGHVQMTRTMWNEAPMMALKTQGSRVTSLLQPKLTRRFHPVQERSALCMLALTPQCPAACPQGT